jgi:hypothetical protein
MGEIRNGYRTLVGKPNGKRPRGRPRFRLEDNIKLDLTATVYEGVVAPDRNQWQAFANTVMKLGYHERQGIS